MNQLTPLVKNLIIINVIVYLSVTYLFPGWSEYFMAYYPASLNFHPVQIVTYMFMHGNLIPHLFFNMFMLYMFGSILEYYWGEKYFLFTYLMSGFGALALHYLVKYISIQYYMSDVPPELYSSVLKEGRSVLMEGQNYIEQLGKINLIVNVPAVGASGATMGMLAAFGTQFPRHKLMLIIPPVELEARIFIPLLIVFELFMGFSNFDNVAHFAHIGGAITGFLLTKYRYKFKF
jgi:membrane associated rhomboid family serine protease